MGQNFVFREEAGERRQTRYGQRGQQEGNVRNGNMFFQSAHFANVLFVAHGVDNAARAKEQQRLEESVRGEVEHGAGISSRAEGEEQITQLADGGIRQHFLNVVLEETDGGGKQGRG